MLASRQGIILGTRTYTSVVSTVLSPGRRSCRSLRSAFQSARLLWPGGGCSARRIHHSSTTVKVGSTTGHRADDPLESSLASATLPGALLPAAGPHSISHLNVSLARVDWLLTRTTTAGRWESWPVQHLPVHLLVAAAVTSFWRGAWYVMDALVFPDSIALSGGATLLGGWAGFAALHYKIIPSMMCRAEDRLAARELVMASGKSPNQQPSPPLQSPQQHLGWLEQHLLLYALGLTVVSTWRGCWLLWDAIGEHFIGMNQQ